MTRCLYYRGDRIARFDYTLHTNTAGKEYAEANLGRIVGEDEHDQNVDNETEAGHEIGRFLGYEEDVDEHIDERRDEQNGGQKPEDRQGYISHIEVCKVR